MNPPTPPYERREAVPLYFYPFLSTRSSLASAEDVRKMAAALEEDRAPEGSATLLYVHIPFCRNLCFFCGFYRHVAAEDTQLVADYVERVIAELRRYAQTAYVRRQRVDAVYIGGGTPSLLPPPLIDRLLREIRQQLRVEPGVEFSFEGEVRSLKDPRRLAVLREHGCTRVSFGVQSFDARVRKLSGLMPSLAEVDECIRQVRQFGYDVNLDLMYGLPGQTHEVWHADVRRAIDLGCANVDMYDTVLYPHTTLFSMRHKLKGELPDEAQRLQMAAEGMDAFERAGYQQETVEDFALPGKAYRMKRLVYGGGDGRSEIIALGAAAVGQLGGFAYRNLPPDEYQAWREDDRELPVQLMQPMGPEDYLKRALVFFPKLLGLRRADMSPENLEAYGEVLDSMKARGLVEESEGCLKPTRAGLLWTDNMAMEFLDFKEQQRIWKIGS